MTADDEIQYPHPTYWARYEVRDGSLVEINPVPDAPWWCGMGDSFVDKSHAHETRADAERCIRESSPT